MARIARNCIKSSFFHVMIQGINKELIFNSDIDKNQYLKFITKAKLENSVNIISYCIMSNHVHMLIQSNSTQNLSKFMHKINTSYAIYYNKKYNRVGYVYRDRYKSQIIYSEEQLYTCINYIHNNPVKARICNKPNEYKYSSFNEYNKNINFYQNKIKEMTSKNLNEDMNKKIIFLEIEEEKEQEIQNSINKYLTKNNLSIKDLTKNETQLKEIILLLRNDYNISLRKISENLKIGREKIRRIINE